MALSTVSGILTRIGMGKLGRLGLEPAERYERARPGELIHIDVKKLGRIQRRCRQTHHAAAAALHRPLHRRRRQAGKAGWEYVHIAIDDATRLAYAEVLPDEKATTAVAFLRRAIAFFARHGMTVERAAHRQRLGLPLHRPRDRLPRARDPPPAHPAHRPQTNGKAERFIRTMLGGWAYGAIYGSSRERTAALDGWLCHYNHHRRHSAIGRQPPITRLNNLLGSYSALHVALG